MEPKEVQKSEEACERAIVDVLRKRYSSSVQPRVCHLMAKAAVAALEAFTEAEARK
ncbi:MAG: hypothetical protein HY288_11615 [Planctomycetia bacterium]|nr:hypothetical protein [Planctomycetia bacterium]